MPDANWKRTERAVATILGGVRVGNRGTSSPDVLSDWLSVECKTRHELPRWLVAAVEQARANTPCGQPARLPLVVLHEHGARHRDDLVVMTVADFQSWFCGSEGLELE